MEQVKNTQSKGTTIAKLLATENITVIQANVSTASFNVQTRVLTLPMWKDVTPYTEDHLIGHEVGHALYTPEEGWHDAVVENDSAFKSYLNVVEDARIEKLVLRKYPGLKRSFIASYREMLAQGFFGGSIDAINKMGLIDRLNTYYKCGKSAGIEFNQDEMQFIPKMDSLESWDDVVRVAEELYAYCLEKEEEKQEQQQQESDEDEAEEDTGGETEDQDASSAMNDGESGESGESSESGEESDDSDEDDSDEDDDEYGDASDGGDLGGVSGSKTDISSKTDKALRDNIDQQMTEDEDVEAYNFTLDAMDDYEKFVVSHKQIFAELSGAKRIGIYPFEHEEGTEDSIHRIRYNPEQWVAIQHTGGLLYKAWQSSNKKIVNHMVKEFEMRKSATAYARTTVSKTGVIDTLKMNNYRISDDIFRKVSVVADGKNHGFIMYLDMSGSMSNYMYETVEQTILLAHFCKQIGVPYKVYGFTDRLRDDICSNEDKRRESTTNILGPLDRSQCVLLELFSNTMKSVDVSTMSKVLLSQYCQYASRGTAEKLAAFDPNLRPYRLRYENIYSRLFHLGGTPLNQAITLGIPLAIKFRKKHNIEVMNTFVLSDGESVTMGAREAGKQNSMRIGSYANGTFPSQKINRVTVLNPHTNKTYRVMKNADGRMTDESEMVFNMYRETVGGNFIGMRIEQQKSTTIGYLSANLRGIPWSADDKDWESIKKQGWVQITDSKMYDEVFIIGSKSLTTNDNKMEEVKSGSLTKAKLRTVFSKSQNSSKNSRMMLTELAKKIAQ